MDDLFSQTARERERALAPLAVRMRPTRLEDYVGQERAVGEGSWLRLAIEHDRLSSVILYGPAGTGKTTLAHIIAARTRSEFVEVSAVSGSVKDLRREIDDAARRLMLTERRTILFIDEIHRFSRSQQDALLHAVENRTVILVGATTENPYFEVNSALLSRSRVVELEHLADDAITTVVKRALASPSGLNGAYTITDEALAGICARAAGDARSALTTLELAAELAQPSKTQAGTYEIDRSAVELANPRRGLPYDKSGDMHYDIVSAFIKSMRGSDPDATIYWLARMIDAGEDPRFIARRILIAASEDIGNADPQALVVAASAFKAAEVIGYPECRINLAQAALYNALAPKSNTAEASIDAALADIKTSGLREVPPYLRDRHRPGSEAYGTYHYPHDDPEGWVAQRYLPEGLDPGAFWSSSGRGWEQWRAEMASHRPQSHENNSL
ncbi:replication-associated recombination protein A [Collinsella sp. AGMB00827]|uniref:Replication-associated recombination protein A n=1 Tax=Collinsella ureilytica TaxID=2869515 RepID=A0ABS7ML47_9ACTN|nr:replication-associated recombination protein A [Collinsella urealyticum]MBY4798102.1 replication-associated recombination protein A [Collinsella urealyticum]